MKKFIEKYIIFIKYIFSAGISFLIDITLFTIFSFILKKFVSSYAIIIATILSRIISSFINYHINRNNVFKMNDSKSKNDRKSFTEYIILVVIQMLVSSFTVFKLYEITGINETLIKVPVEGVLFIVNYLVQKYIIFNK